MRETSSETVFSNYNGIVVHMCNSRNTKAYLMDVFKVYNEHLLLSVRDSLLSSRLNDESGTRVKGSKTRTNWSIYFKPFLLARVSSSSKSRSAKSSSMSFETKVWKNEPIFSVTVSSSVIEKLCCHIHTSFAVIVDVDVDDWQGHILMRR